MRIVIKIGTSTLTHGSGHLNIRRVEALCKTLSDIRNAGHALIVVTSGAIAMGVSKLGLKKRPDDIPTKQAAAAVGQCELMYVYDKLFGEYHHTVSQLLITGDDTRSPERHRNFSNTLERLLELGALPIINENDTVATEELGIGDNDTLAAIVAESVRADLLILLSDKDGLYTDNPDQNPDAKFIDTVDIIDDKILAMGKGPGTSVGKGGMSTKISAARIATDSGADMIITNAEDISKLGDVLEGGHIGTLFKAHKNIDFHLINYISHN